MAETLRPETEVILMDLSQEVDTVHPLGIALNFLFAVFRSSNRARRIFYKQEPRVWGIFSEEEAKTIMRRLEMNQESGKKEDPLLSDKTRKLQRILKLID